MKRKLIRQGGSGLVAYVPKKWIDDKNLKAGDEIMINEEEGDLIISADTRDRKKDIKLDFTSEDPLFIRLIINDLYREGFDKMIINYSSKAQRDMINETIGQSLLGFEISEKNDGMIVLENVAVPDENKQDVLLRRIFLIIEELFEIISDGLKKNQYGDHNHVLDLKRKIGQYDNFSRRNISKKKFYQESSSFYWMLYNHLFLISHSLIHLYEILRSDKKRVVSKNVISIFNKSNDFYLKMYSGFFKSDLDLLKGINFKMDRFLYTEVHGELKKSKGLDSVALYYLGELSRLLYKTNSPILGILLTNKRKS